MEVSISIIQMKWTGFPSFTRISTLLIISGRAAHRKKEKLDYFKVGKKKQTNKINRAEYTAHTHSIESVPLWIVFGLAKAEITTKINDEKLWRCNCEWMES